jgi:hypothetical protein
VKLPTRSVEEKVYVNMEEEALQGWRQQFMRAGRKNFYKECGDKGISDHTPVEESTEVQAAYVW